jgi:hypothetical protein
MIRRLAIISDLHISEGTLDDCDEELVNTLSSSRPRTAQTIRLVSQ